MRSALIVFAACLILTGCASTTPAVEYVATSCPPPPSPDPSLLVPPTEFVPLPVGEVEDAQALGVITTNVLRCSADRNRLQLLQQWAAPESN